MKEQILNFLGNLPFGNILLNPYVLAGVTIILFVILSFLVLFIFNHYLQNLAKKTKTEVDDLIFDKTKKPLFALFMVYGFKLAIEILWVNSVMDKIITSAMTLVFLFILLRVFDVVVGTWGLTFAKKTKSSADEVLLPIMHKVAKVIFFIVGFMWLLHIWGIDITPYLAGVGISGLVLGLALQDSLKNVFGGVTLLLDRTFKIGDKIQLESGEIGTIYDIGLRSTKLVTIDNEIIYVPNGYLSNSRVQNYTRPTPKARVNVLFGVEYGSDINKVKKVVLAALAKLEDIEKEPVPEVQFLEMGDFALSCKALFWVERWDMAYGKKLEATQLIYEALNKAKISIPFPTQTVYVKK